MGRGTAPRLGPGVVEGQQVRPDKPVSSIQRARRLRKHLSKPEALLWQVLRRSPGGYKFRKQHPAGPFVLDFFCARVNLAIEVDGFAHDIGDRPERDLRRDGWLSANRIDTMRVPAHDVLADAVAVADSIVAVVGERMRLFGKAPPSSRRDATSPSQGDGEDQ